MVYFASSLLVSAFSAMVVSLERMRPEDRFTFMENWCAQMTGMLKLHSDDDPITECELDLNMLDTVPGIVRDAAYSKLQVFPFKDVRECWKRLYTDASIAVALLHLKTHLRVVTDEEMREAWVETVVRTLDMAIIMVGAPRREKMIEGMFEQIEEYIKAVLPDASKCSSDGEIPNAFPSADIYVPKLEFPVPRSQMIMLPFMDILDIEPVTPLVSKLTLTDWPAVHSSNPWSNPKALLAKTFNGRRLVPIELGLSYTSSDFGQSIMKFADFMSKYLLNPQPDKLGYLAQHDIFLQIPALKEDIRVPFVCGVTPPLPPSGTPMHAKYEAGEVSQLPEPLVRAWFGPAGTISPLHTDPYHNVLCQVYGKKYIRLYPPEETPKMYPRGIDSKGIDMSNTSRIPAEMVEMNFEIEIGAEDDDAEFGVEKLPDTEDEEEPHEKFPLFREAKYMETVLHEGESLYIPVGWWHYVRSLDVSLSVSFWWN